MNDAMPEFGVEAGLDLYYGGGVGVCFALCHQGQRGELFSS